MRRYFWFNGEIIPNKYFQHFDRSKTRHDRAKLVGPVVSTGHRSKIILSLEGETMNFKRLYNNHRLSRLLLIEWVHGKQPQVTLDLKSNCHFLYKEMKSNLLEESCGLSNVT